MTNCKLYQTLKKDNIECTNLKVNVNGLNFTALPEPLRNLLESQAQTEDSDIGFTSGNGKKRLGYDKDFAFICCKNFNENQVIILPSPNPPIANNVYVVWYDDTTGNSEIFFVFCF